MRHLTLLRHAKSSWDDPALADRERPLAPRGERDLAIVAEVIAGEEFAFDRCLSSDAVRARSTAAAVAAACGFEVTRCGDCYTFDDEELLDAIATHAEDAADLLVVGHNPAMHAGAEYLTGRALRKFPTAAFARLRCPIDYWRELPLAAGECELLRFVRPKDYR